MTELSGTTVKTSKLNSSNNCIDSSTTKFDPESNETVNCVFEKVSQNSSVSGITGTTNLTAAMIETEDLYKDTPGNKDGIIKAGNLTGEARNYANQDKDGKIKDTSYTDVAVNDYNKKMGVTPNKCGARVETEFSGQTGETKSYYNKDNTMYKKETRENGVLTSKFEKVDDNTTISTTYEKDGKTIKTQDKVVTVTNKDKTSFSPYDKDGKLSGKSETTLIKTVSHCDKDGKLTTSQETTLLEKHNGKGDDVLTIAEKDANGNIISAEKQHGIMGHDGEFRESMSGASELTDTQKDGETPVVEKQIDKNFLKQITDKNPDVALNAISNKATVDVNGKKMSIAEIIPSFDKYSQGESDSYVDLCKSYKNKTGVEISNMVRYRGLAGDEYTIGDYRVHVPMIEPTSIENLKTGESITGWISNKGKFEIDSYKDPTTDTEVEFKRNGDNTQPESATITANNEKKTIKYGP